MTASDDDCGPSAGAAGRRAGGAARAAALGVVGDLGESGHGGDDTSPVQSGDRSLWAAAAALLERRDPAQRLGLPARSPITSSPSSGRRPRATAAVRGRPARRRRLGVSRLGDDPTRLEPISHSLSASVAWRCTERRRRGLVGAEGGTKTVKRSPRSRRRRTPAIGVTVAPTACSASTRWIVVSCAMRRGQNPARWWRRKGVHRAIRSSMPGRRRAARPGWPGTTRAPRRRADRAASVLRDGRSIVPVRRITLERTYSRPTWRSSSVVS